MDGENLSTDHVIAELLNMGFEFNQAVEATRAVGSCLEDAVEFILNGYCGGDTVNSEQVSSPVACSTSQPYPMGQRVSSLRPSRRVKQSSISDLFSSSGNLNNDSHHCASSSTVNRPKRFKSECLDEQKVSNTCMNIKLEPISESSQQNSHDHVHRIELDALPSQKIGTFQSQEMSPRCSSVADEIYLDWEKKVRGILQKHFGFSSLKSFQKEALGAWLAHKDCLVLAATGSGKSLCFQLPALLTGKVVVVISPLISLMHDQCLKLARHGVSACFLGSGQPDRTVECKAMSGMYSIIYVCPETVLSPLFAD